jgi:hypothetical protein
MPTTAAPATRVRRIETTTSEEVPVNPNENQGLGMPWEDYLRNLPEDELAITEVKVYREEPKKEGYLCKVLGEAVDESWIFERYGGGTFMVRIWSKAGKSHLERNVKIAGPPKLTPTELPAPAAAVVAPVPAENGRDFASVLALLEKTIERLERVQAGNSQPSHAQDAAVDIVASAAKRAIELAGANAPAPAAQNSLDADLQRLKAMKDIFMPAKPPEDDFDKALKQAMLKKFLDPPPSQNKSLIEELKGLGEVRELLGWNEGGGKGEHWTTALIHQAPAVLERLSEISTQRVQATQNELERTKIVARARGAMPPAGPAISPAPVQTSANEAAPGRTAPVAGPIRMAPMGGGGGAVVEPVAPAAEVNPSSLNTESEPFIQFVKERIVMMVNAGEPGGAIVGFLTGAGQHQLIGMMVKYSPEQITAFLKNDPVLVQATENPDWLDVLDEARQYIRENADGEEPEADKTPTVQ